MSDNIFSCSDSAICSASLNTFLSSCFAVSLVPRFNSSVSNLACSRSTLVKNLFSSFICASVAILFSRSNKFLKCRSVNRCSCSKKATAASSFLLSSATPASGPPPTASTPVTGGRLASFSLCVTSSSILDLILSMASIEP